MNDNEISEACESFERYTVNRLKQYLKYLGQPVSGTKRDLIDRIKGAKKLFIEDITSIKERNEEERVARKQGNLITPLGEKLSHPNVLLNWTDDITKVPDFDEKDIYNYIVLKMNSKKQLKSKVFYEDGHVHNVRLSSVNEGSTHCYVKADVLPSMPTSNKKDSPDYSVWVMLSKVSGCVNSAECNCTAGEGEACNHIAALLYAVADIAEKKKDGKLSTTSHKCKWNNPRKRKLSPKKAEDLTFRKHYFGKTTFSRTKISLIRETDSTVNITRFRERLLKNKSKAGWLTNFVKTESVKEPNLPCLHSGIIFQFSNKVNLRSQFCRDLFTNYFEKLKIREEDCIQIEILTRPEKTGSQPQILGKLPSRKQKLNLNHY